MSGAPGRRSRQPDPAKGDGDQPENGVASALSELHVALLKMDAAVIAEGIDPNGPLGVFCQAQRSMIAAMISCMQDMVSKVDDRADAVGATMNAEVERVRVGIEQMHQETLKFRAETTNIREQVLKMSDDMALRMSDKIQDKLKSATLVREKRWNRLQNLQFVAIGVVSLLAAYLGGQLMQSYSEARAIVERCHDNASIDRETKIPYCRMTIVDGLSDPIAGGAR